jgi:hypothetical protein
MAIISITISIFSVIIAIYGLFLKIPPFISITDAQQFSPLLIEHLKIIPSIPLSWIVSLYTIVIAVVLLEFIISSKYIEIINRKLEELFILKYRIDRYQLGVSSELNIENILKTLSRQKIHPPSYIIVGGILSIPIPLHFSRCEEMLYSALQDQPVVDMEEVHP